MRYFLILLFSVFGFIQHINANHLYTNPTDSIGIKVINNRTYILHKVNPGDEINTVAARYGVTSSEIKEANKNIQNDNLTVGAIILVPLARRSYANTSVDEAALEAAFIKRVYTVESGDYIYKIARDFNMDVKRLKELNELESEVLTAGQQLIVEIPAAALQENNNNVTASNNTDNQNETSPVINTANANASMNPANQLTRVPKVHTVQEGEYLFSLGRNLNVNLDSVRVWNYMEPADNISLNQEVIVGYNYFNATGNLILSTGADIADVNGYKAGNVEGGTSDIGNQGTTSFSTLTPEVKLNNIPKNVSEQGVAMRITGNDASANQIVGLHKTAPYGTYIRVTNPSNGRNIAVKIIGTIPENTTPNNQVIIMLSAAACQRIGALNNQFPVSLSYNK